PCRAGWRKTCSPGSASMAQRPSPRAQPIPAGFASPLQRRQPSRMRATARQAFIAAVGFGGGVPARLRPALLFLAFSVSAAMRPSVETLRTRFRIPRGAGILMHYAALAGLLGLLLWLLLPRAIAQTQ